MNVTVIIFVQIWSHQHLRISTHATLLYNIIILLSTHRDMIYINASYYCNNICADMKSSAFIHVYTYNIIILFSTHRDMIYINALYHIEMHVDGIAHKHWHFHGLALFFLCIMYVSAHVCKCVHVPLHAADKIPYFRCLLNYSAGVHQTILELFIKLFFSFSLNHPWVVIELLCRCSSNYSWVVHWSIVEVFIELFFAR